MRLYRMDLPKPAAWPPPHDGDTVASALRYARLTDPYGHAAHTVIAAIHLFMLPLAHALGAISFGVLAGYSLLRVWVTWRSYTVLLRLPVTWMMLAFFLWCAASIIWSADRVQGLDELAALRMLALPAMLWPVLGHVAWLIAALLAGVFVQNLIQFAQMFEVLGFKPLDVGRIRGLLHPIQTGAWCLVAMCLHLAAIIQSRGLIRWLCVIGLVFAGAGLLASGSRGPWIAAAVAIPLGIVLMLVRRPTLLKPAFVLGVVMAIAGTAGFIVAGDHVRDRVETAKTELQDAMNDHVYVTSVGLRVAMWKWALEIAHEAPIAGTGAGSFRKESADLDSFKQAAERWPDEIDYLSRAQPHSSHLYMLQSGGTIGLSIFWAMLIAIAVQTWRDRDDHPFAFGMAIVLISWIVGAGFDSYNLSGTMLGALAVVAATTLRFRAPIARRNDSLQSSDNEENSCSG